MANSLTGFNSANVQGPILSVLRQNAVFPRLCQNLRGTDPVNRGSTIDLPKTSAITARAITAAETPASNQDMTSSRMQLSIDQWFEASYFLTDQEALHVKDGVMSAQMQEAIKSIGNQIDLTGWYVARGNPGAGVSGTPATTPFSSTGLTVLAAAKRLLTTQLAPVTDRYLVVDPVIEQNLITVPNILQTERYGGSEGIRLGSLGRVLGFDAFVNQNISTLTAGTTAWGTGYSCPGAAAVAATNLTLLNSTCHGTIYPGTMFKSGSGYYAVSATVTAVTNTGFTAYFQPPLATAISSGDAVTVVAAYTPAVAFHRQALAFCSRPAEGAFDGRNTASVTDPVTGVTLTFKITDEYYQQTMRVSCLWGWKAVRPEFICQIAG